VGVGWRRAGPLPARGVKSRVCPQRQRRPPPSIDCPRTRPGVLECLPCANVGPRLGGKRVHGGEWRGNRPISLQLAATGASSFPAWHRALGHTRCTADAIQKRVVGARLHGPAAACGATFAQAPLPLQTPNAISSSSDVMCMRHRVGDSKNYAV